jgi:Ala-tRNA(Pro) deacylase
MKVVDYLEEVSAKYEVMQHSPAFTAQEMAAEEHVPGMNVAKPVVIKADDEYYMCVLPACCKVDFDALKEQLGARRVDLVTEGEMAKLFPDCELGAEPPLGSLYGLMTIMDVSLDEDDYIVFQGGTHEEAVKMALDEYKRLTSPRILDFSCHMS